jgi:ferredoxin-like protein FixX
MALWFLRGLRRGVVTTRYPAAADTSATFLPTPPIFDPERLDDALVDRLVELCPSQALYRERDALIFDAGACTSCGRCLPASNGALRPSGQFELATTRRDHLIKRIPVGGI